MQSTLLVMSCSVAVGHPAIGACSSLSFGLGMRGLLLGFLMTQPCNGATSMALTGARFCLEVSIIPYCPVPRECTSDEPSKSGKRKGNQPPNKEVQL